MRRPNPETRSFSQRRPAEVDKLIGDRLRLRRELRGLSLGELGALCKISPQQISKYEHGHSRMPVSRLIQFAEILDVPLSWFVSSIESRATLPDDLVDLLTARDTGEILLLFRKITDPLLRKIALANLRSLLQLQAKLAERAPEQNANHPDTGTRPHRQAGAAS